MAPFSALLCASMLSAAWAGSWTINSKGGALHWEVSEIPYRINPNGKHGLARDAVEPAIQAAAGEWNLDGAWIELVYAGATELAAADNDDGAQVVFFEEAWPDTLSPDLLALAYVWSYDDGEITHFDIAINTEDHDWGVEGEPDVNDLRNALTHEFGHALGLDHSEDPEATMFYQTSVGETAKRDLAEDDVSTYTSVYGGSYPFEALGPVGCSSLGGRTRGSGGLLVAAVVAGLAAGGRRRDRRAGKREEGRQG